MPFAANAATPAGDDLLAEVEALGVRIAAVRAQVGRAIYGQPEVVDQTLITLLSGGHVLLVGVPGLGKSRLVETLAIVLGVASKRVQFTPDLMPADILGSEVLDEEPGGRRSFRFVPGPVFCQLLMADEINRASPRTQSALLQAMQEQRVAVGGVEYPLPRPFHVLATQNPIELEGTYPLPEAQLDRFIFNTLLDYLSADHEMQVLSLTTTTAKAVVVPVTTAEEILDFQQVVRMVPIADLVARYAIDLVRATRATDPTSPDFVRKYVNFGASVRAAQFLVLASKARALMRHRILLNFQAESDRLTQDDILKKLLEAMPPPKA